FPTDILGRVARIAIIIVVREDARNMNVGMAKYISVSRRRINTDRITDIIMELTLIRMLALPSAIRLNSTWFCEVSRNMVCIPFVINDEFCLLLFSIFDLFVANKVSLILEPFVLLIFFCR